MATARSCQSRDARPSFPWCTSTSVAGATGNLSPRLCALAARRDRWSRSGGNTVQDGNVHNRENSCGALQLAKRNTRQWVIFLFFLSSAASQVAASLLVRVREATRKTQIDSTRKRGQNRIKKKVVDTKKGGHTPIGHNHR
ncbi:hypothetical protein [Pandoravirus japonicus]|uniref:Uncharacterized protein n=1 Tax=Pandoravirus japonicus TaxID=2823154 RepID=A0A811BP80_9VIRU|nr:hypothetical protein [Pandoravirus japonicus]